MSAQGVAVGIGNRARRTVAALVVLSATAVASGSLPQSSAAPSDATSAMASRAGGQDDKLVVRVHRPSEKRKLGTGDFVDVSADVRATNGHDVVSCSIKWGNGYVSGNLRNGTSCVGGASYNLPGRYRIKVRATDDEGNVAKDTVRVIVHFEKTVVTGDGKISDPSDPNGVYSFETFAKLTKDGPVGRLEVRGPKGAFSAKSIKTITVPKGVVWWSGTGRWKGQDGYTFDAAAYQPQSKKGADRVDVTVRDPKGETVMSFIGYRPAAHLELRR